MFTATMVNDFIGNISKQNPSDEKQHCTSESNIKPCKRQSKKSRIKSCAHVEGFEQMPDTPFNRTSNSNGQRKTNNKTVAPTKVKSASWKRSEKSTAPFNTVASKKHKMSSNWLKFSNSKIKKSDTEQPHSRSESLSACIPGTTYSDVLFGAGCSNLVKIKNCITPRFYSNQSTGTAQKKFNKSLFKFNGKSDNKISADSEADEKKPLFPALQTFKNKFFSASLKIGSNNCNKDAEKTQMYLTTSSTSPLNQNVEAETLILSDMADLTLKENRKTHGSYLEQQLEHVAAALETNTATFANDNKYILNSITKMPKWNFTCVETGTSDGFPKFLYQFEDENYLKAEKMALLGLKLALGNSIPKNK